jgi:hypothetical protein
MSLTFAELNNIVDFNVKEWIKVVDNRVIIIKNTSIPEEAGELSAIISSLPSGEILVRTTIRLMGKGLFKCSKEKVFDDIEELQLYLRRLDNLDTLSLAKIEIELVDAFDKSVLEMVG